MAICLQKFIVKHDGPDSVEEFSATVCYDRFTGGLPKFLPYLVLNLIRKLPKANEIMLL
jgi:hypothetical protein